MAININTCSKNELEQLKGIGQKMSDRIMTHRPFEDKRDLICRVKGMGKTTLDNISERNNVEIVFDQDLNGRIHDGVADAQSNSNSNRVRHQVVSRTPIRITSQDGGIGGILWVPRGNGPMWVVGQNTIRID
eukprot:374260_1